MSAEKEKKQLHLSRNQYIWLSGDDFQVHSLIKKQNSLDKWMILGLLTGDIKNELAASFSARK